MARAPCTFRQRDVTAAVKALVAAGVAVKRFELGKDGKIIVVIGEAEKLAAEEAGETNEWDSAV
jgi:hypothetical protein